MRSIFFITFSVFFLQFANVNSQGILKGVLVYNNGKDTLYLGETNPDHFPKINLFYGAGFSGIPHFPILATQHIEGFFNYPKYGSVNFKFVNMYSVIRNWYSYEWVSGYRNDKEERPFYSVEISGNAHLLNRYKKENIDVFHQQKRTGVNQVELTYFEVPALKHEYIDLSLGYLYYQDIISSEMEGNNEELRIYSTDGTFLEDVFLNMRNNVFQVGVIYGKENFIKGKTKFRNYRSIVSDRYYFHILYSPESIIEEILYDDYFGNEITLHQVNKLHSKLKENNFGFKFGNFSSDAIYGDRFGVGFGWEIGLYPGIIGFPNWVFNLYGRYYICLSFQTL